MNYLYFLMSQYICINYGDHEINQQHNFQSRRRWGLEWGMLVKCKSVFSMGSKVMFWLVKRFILIWQVNNVPFAHFGEIYELQGAVCNKPLSHGISGEGHYTAVCLCSGRFVLFTDSTVSLDPAKVKYWLQRFRLLLYASLLSRNFLNSDLLSWVDRATIEASITQTSSPPVSFLGMSVCIYNLNKWYLFYCYFDTLVIKVISLDELIRFWKVSILLSPPTAP